MNGGWIFLIALILLFLAAYLSWILYSRHQASRLGLPPPSLNPFARGSSSSSAAAPFPAPASGGIRGWFDTQVRRFKNRNNRYATGAYEEAGYGGAGSATRGRSRLDPDEAWDTRVGNEAHYEEQELGLHAPESNSGYRTASPGFANAGTGAGGEPEQRGRSRTREYDEDDRSTLRNPFGDENASASLRGVSPRPLDMDMNTSYGGSAAGGAQQGHKKNAQSTASLEDSPTERRSLFRENI